jgi:hypothetical protein
LAHAPHLLLEPLGQLAAAEVGQRGDGAQGLLVGCLVAGPQAHPPCFGQRQGGPLRQPRPLQQILQVAHLPAGVQVDAYGNDLLLLLVADELDAEPEHRLEEVQSPHALHLQFERWAQGKGSANPTGQIVRVQVQPDQVELPGSAPPDGVLEQAIDQGRPEAGQLGAGVFG